MTKTIKLISLKISSLIYFFKYQMKNFFNIKNIDLNQNRKNLKILIFMNYFLLWLYIIIISIPYVKID